MFVITEFARAGRQCFGHQLEVLVESEFQRICRELYKTDMSIPQQNSSYQQQSDYQHHSSYQGRPLCYGGNVKITYLSVNSESHK